MISDKYIKSEDMPSPRIKIGPTYKINISPTQEKEGEA
jgi:hypothetical protein